MAASFTPDGRAAPLPSRSPAASLKPFETAKLLDVAAEAARCEARGCGATVDRTTLNPIAMRALCVFGHPMDLGPAFARAQAIAEQASRPRRPR